jgi:hypothetical protein
MTEGMYKKLFFREGMPRSKNKSNHPLIKRRGYHFREDKRYSDRKVKTTNYFRRYL